MSHVTASSRRSWNDGDPDALKQLLDVVYPELKRLADNLLRHERADHTLQPTALVHEAYIRLDAACGGCGSRAGGISTARRRWPCGASWSITRGSGRPAKRGGADLARAPIEDALNAPVDLRLDFERLDEALEELALFAPEKAKMVELRYFAGLSIEETAALLDIAPATVKRHWTFARAWLHRALSA